LVLPLIGLVFGVFPPLAIHAELDGHGILRVAVDIELRLVVHAEGKVGDIFQVAFLDPRGQELSNLNASYAKEVTLSDNDGVLYYGPDIVHWREPLDATLTQIVFAFREEDVAHCNNQ
jgi:hypothetical protein